MAAHSRVGRAPAGGTRPLRLTCGTGRSVLPPVAPAGRDPARPQGSDLAGVVVATGPAVRGFAVGDEVLGFTHPQARWSSASWPGSPRVGS